MGNSIDNDIKMRQRIIVVLGMHRSGTSAITRGLKALGVDLGEKTIPPAGNNEKGFWEDVDVNILDNELLHYLGHDWYTLSPVQQSELMSDNVASFKNRAVEILRQKLSGKSIFGLKDPRISRLLPFWKSVFNYLEIDVAYVIAVRNPLSVAQSLKVRDGFDSYRSHYLWLDHFARSVLDSENSPRVFIDYDLLLAQPEKQLQRMAAALELSFEASSPDINTYIKKFLANDLRHTQFHINDLKSAPDISPRIVDSYILLDELARDKVLATSKLVHDHFTNISGHLDEMSPTFNYITKMDQQIIKLKQSTVERDAELFSLYSSISWRVTKPLRYFRRLLT